MLTSDVDTDPRWFRVFRVDDSNSEIPVDQWSLTFLKSGNTFDYMKNLRNTEINDAKKQTKISRVEISIF